MSQRFQVAVNLYNMLARARGVIPPGPERDGVFRPLVCTPYYGCYGDVAGWVLIINGSPPKGALYYHYSGGPDEETSYTYINGRCNEPRRPVRQSPRWEKATAFAREFLTGGEAHPFEIRLHADGTCEVEKIQTGGGK